MKKDTKLMKKKHVQERRAAYKFLLAIPPIVALAMIAFVSFTHQAVVVEDGIFLSPVKDSSPLILSLSIFIIGYLIFIGLLFKESLMQFVDSKITPRN